MKSDVVRSSWPFIERQMVSDDEGIIRCHQVYDGPRFGGTTCTLFWIFPIDYQGYPKLYCLASSDQYKTMKIPLGSLFEDNAKLSGTTTTYSQGEMTVLLDVYVHVFVLTIRDPSD